MKLELTRGCISGSLNADGVEEMDMTPQERQKVIQKISKWLQENPEELNYVLQALIPQFGDYSCDDEPCECCGDLITTYTWEI